MFAIVLVCLGLIADDGAFDDRRGRPHGRRGVPGGGEQGGARCQGAPAAGPLVRVARDDRRADQAPDDGVAV